VLWKLFEYTKSGDKRTTAFNPLFYYETNKKGDWSLALLGWLYQYTREAGKGSHRLFYFIKF
jgi:hypothetical protein